MKKKGRPSSPCTLLTQIFFERYPSWIARQFLVHRRIDAGRVGKIRGFRCALVLNLVLVRLLAVFARDRRVLEASNFGCAHDSYDHVVELESTPLSRDSSVTKSELTTDSIICRNDCVEIHGWLVEPLQGRDAKQLAEYFPVVFESKGFSLRRPAVDFKISRRLKGLKSPQPNRWKRPRKRGKSLRPSC